MAHDKMIVLTLRDGFMENDLERIIAHMRQETLSASRFSVWSAVESIQVRPFEPLVKEETQRDPH